MRTLTPEERKKANTVRGLFRLVDGVMVNLFRFNGSKCYNVWVGRGDNETGVYDAESTLRVQLEFSTLEEAWEYYMNDAVVLL